MYFNKEIFYWSFHKNILIILNFGEGYFEVVNSSSLEKNVSSFYKQKFVSQIPSSHIAHLSCISYVYIFDKRTPLNFL